MGTGNSNLAREGRCLLLSQQIMTPCGFLLALTILLPKVFAQNTFDESGILTVSVLVSAAILLAIGIIWIIFCYCICKIGHDYQTERKRIEQNAALSRRIQQERAHRQQCRAQARRNYRQITSPQEPSRREVPQTPRLDHPHFQPTFLHKIARTPSMELLQGEGRQVASHPAPSAGRSPHVTFNDEIAGPCDGSHSNFTLQGGQRIPHSRSFDLNQTTLWPDTEEPPRYSHLFGEHESNRHHHHHHHHHHQQQQQQRGKGDPGNGYHPGSGIPPRQPSAPQAMPFQFSVQPPTHSSGTRDQPAQRPKQPPWSRSRPPESHKRDMTQFNQLTSWPQFN